MVGVDLARELRREVVTERKAEVEEHARAERALADRIDEIGLGVDGAAEASRGVEFWGEVIIPVQAGVEEVDRFGGEADVGPDIGTRTADSVEKFRRGEQEFAVQRAAIYRYRPREKSGVVEGSSDAHL